MANTNQARIYLDISSDEYLSYYTGSARNVVSVASDGRRIRFPANILRPFVTHDGVQGHFVIEFDGNNKFVAINKISG